MEGRKSKGRLLTRVSFRYLSGERSVVLLDIDFDAEYQDHIVRTIRKLSDLMRERNIELSKAKELYFLSDKIPAEEALKLGLTNWVVKHEELEQKTLEIAKQLAEGPAVAFRYMKENLNRAVSGEVDDCLDLEVTHHVHCGQTEDHKNATKAFVEKKQPVFKGR